MESIAERRLHDRPVVAVFRGPLFNPSEGFVQAQAVRLTRYRPVVVGLTRLGHVAPELEDGMLVANSAEKLAIRLLGRWGRLGARIATLRPVLVHAHFATDGLAALPLARLLGVPLVTSLRGYDVTRSPEAMLRSGRLSWMRYAIGRRRLMVQGDLFLAVSDALRERAIAAGFPADRVETHYNGVDLAQFRPGPESREPGLVLFVGRLVEKKGVGVLLDAFASALGAVPDARLVIVGDGPLRDALGHRCRTLGIASALEFRGALPAESVAALMRRAWLLAAPSLTAADGDAEGLPNAVVEALASGLPVVGSDHAGIPEAVEHGRTGFLVPEGQAAPLATRIVELLGAPDLRNAMGQAGRSLAHARFDLARQIDRLEAIYDRLGARARRFV